MTFVFESRMFKKKKKKMKYVFFHSFLPTYCLRYEHSIGTFLQAETHFILCRLPSNAPVSQPFLSSHTRQTVC